MMERQEQMAAIYTTGSGSALTERGATRCEDCETLDSACIPHGKLLFWAVEYKKRGGRTWRSLTHRYHENVAACFVALAGAERHKRLQFRDTRTGEVVAVTERKVSAGADGEAA